MFGKRLKHYTLENMGQWPPFVKSAAFVALITLVLLIGYCLLIQENFASYDVLRGQEQVLKLDLELKQGQASNINGYQHQLQLLETQFKALLKQGLADSDFSAVLEDILKAGLLFGLKFQQFIPQEEIEEDFYKVVPIKITVIGTYKHLALFMSRLAQMRRIISVHEFSIKKIAIENNGLAMQIIMKIYRQRLL